MYGAGMYARAQAMRRDGTAPKALGIADGLPDRMALQQLNALAGMADKVGGVPVSGAGDGMKEGARGQNTSQRSRSR